MQVFDVIQGSPEWVALRRDYYTASEAPAMMGASKFMTYTQLMEQKATGIVPEVDAHRQARFDRGHEAEAAYRPIAERDISDDLYPVTGAIDLDGLPLLASFDGLTMDERTGFEHKLYREALAQELADFGEPGPEYFWQLEHQLLVSGANRIMFVTSDGTDNHARWVWYESKPERRAALIAGWKQFHAARQTFKPAPVALQAVAAPVVALPAVLVTVNGTITVQDNFDDYELALEDFAANRLVRDPTTDDHFATLDQQIKMMKSAEGALEAGETQMLAQVEAVYARKRRKDALLKRTRDLRLMSEKLLEAQKQAIRSEIVLKASTEWHEHMADLNRTIGRQYMPQIAADFAGAIKGKKTVASLHDAVKVEMARCKIVASEAFHRIQANMATLREQAADYAFLFNDTAQLVLKPTDDLRTLAAARIAEHKAKEAEKEIQQRAQIQREEAERAEKAAQAKIDEANRQAQAQIAETERRAREMVAAQAPAPAPIAAPPVAAAPVVVPLRSVSIGGPPSAPIPMTAPTLKLGTICARLEKMTVTADNLRALGFEPAAKDRGACLYHEHQYPHILAAIVRHVESLQAQQAA